MPAAASFRWILELHKDVPKAAKFYSEGLDFSVNVCTLRWAELRSGPLKLALMQSSKFIRRNLAANAYRLNIQRKNFCTNPATNLSRSESSDAAQAKNDEEEKLSISCKNHNHDVAIVGGGMVGLALACSLASMPLTKQLKIAIIDSNPALKSGTLVKKDDPPDPRVSTVTPATISFLQDVDAWKYIEQHRHAYFDKMQVWDYTGLGYTRYGARDINKDILGCVVENKVLMSSLFSCLQDKEFPKTIYPSRLASMTIPLSSTVGNTYSGASDELGNLAKLELSDGSSLHAKLVVGADGSKSRVRELAKFKTTGWSYAQNAVICMVEHTIENHCAWQRFLPAGPIALLPMSENYSNIVWTMSPEDATKRLSMSEEDFVKDVNHALDYGYGPHPKPSILGGGDIFSWMNKDSSFSANEMFEVPPKVVNLASQRMVFPLSLMHSNRYASKRVALIGDAAHTVHPLAGQGVNLGFSDAFALSKVIAKGIALGTDIGEVSLLKKLEVERKASNIAMMAILDGFQKAYSINFGPLNILRAAAMHGAQYISPLKKTIISYASGDKRLPLFT